jgi:hypothetical protein
VRILIHKLTDERYALEIVRDGGARERVECETRSTLRHDLLHYATESEAKLDGGFWGLVARGKTLADMNDRTGMALAAEWPELMEVERVVGALHGLDGGRSAEAVVGALRTYCTALGETMPAWLTPALVAAVAERMRELTGRWRATPFGRAMELAWPPERADRGARAADLPA